MELHSVLARTAELPGSAELTEVLARIPHLDGPQLGTLALVRSQPDPPDELVELRGEILSPDLPFVTELLDLHVVADTLTRSSLAQIQLRTSWLGTLPLSLEAAVELAAAAVRDALTGALASAQLEHSHRQLLMAPWWQLSV